MGPTTMDFIKVLKGKHSLETDGTTYDAIATFMADRCGIPKEGIDARDVFDFTRDCVIDYARTCDDPLSVLSRILTIRRGEKEERSYMLTLIDTMAYTLQSTRVQYDGKYVNGFTESGMKKRVRPSTK